jgi:hypothetical protein
MTEWLITAPTSTMTPAAEFSAPRYLAAGHRTQADALEIEAAAKQSGTIRPPAHLKNSLD